MFPDPSAVAVIVRSASAPVSSWKSSVTVSPGAHPDPAIGTASPTIPKDQRPSADWPAGIQLGLFRVRISKKVDGVEKIPAKYNTDTTLGMQIAPDDPAIVSHRIEFKLESK